MDEIVRIVTTDYLKGHFGTTEWFDVEAIVDRVKDMLCETIHNVETVLSENASLRMAIRDEQITNFHNFVVTNVETIFEPCFGRLGENPEIQRQFEKMVVYYVVSLF